MRKFGLLMAVIGLSFTVGCAGIGAGVSPYRSIALNRDLDAATLARYRAETEKAVEAGQRDHVVVLERSNWWPLGLVAYWHRGSVRAMRMLHGDTVYMVSRSRGYGPLSVAYVSKEDASFGTDGKRLNGMTTSSVLWGHLAMFHVMGSQADHGGWQRHESAHLLHHIINWTKAHGKVSFSLFSAPNPVGFGD